MVQLTQPRALPVPVAPDDDRVAQIVQLRATLATARPQVGQRTTELGVPHQRRQIVDDHGHAHMIDGTVRGHPNGAIGHLVAAKEPYITGPRQVDGLIEADPGFGHGCSLGRCGGGSWSDWQASSVSPPLAW